MASDLLAWSKQKRGEYTVKIIRPRNTLKVLQSVASKFSVSVQLVLRKETHIIDLIVQLCTRNFRITDLEFKGDF